MARAHRFLGFVDGAVDGLGAEHVAQDLRVDADLIAAAPAVDEDLLHVEDRALDVDGHDLLRAEGTRAAHEIAGIALRLFGLAGGDVLHADLPREILRRDFGVPVHEDDEGLGVFVLHDKGLDHLVMIEPAGRGGKRRAAVLDVFVGLFFKGNLVGLEPLRGGSEALMLFLGHFLS